MKLTYVLMKKRVGLEVRQMSGFAIPGLMTWDKLFNLSLKPLKWKRKKTDNVQDYYKDIRLCI